MPVNTKHRFYEARDQQWKRLRDFLEGDMAVKGAQECYLPKLEGETDDEYTARIKRTPFFNATARTHEALVGEIFRKDPEVILPENGLAADACSMLSLDADMTGKTLYDYARHVVSEVIAVGRGLTLVDWNKEENRPYFSFYMAEDIINWRAERIKGRMRLVLVVLRERKTEFGFAGYNIGDVVEMDGGAFEGTGCDQFRVLRLVKSAQSGDYIYQQEIVQERPTSHEAEGAKSKVAPSRRRRMAGANTTAEAEAEVASTQEAPKNEFRVIDLKRPKHRGKLLRDIPVIFHGPDAVSLQPARPPLDDLVVLNLEHYQTGADHKHALHFTALPTCVVSGLGNAVDEFEGKIGSSVIWKFADKDTKAVILEYQGQGLESFEHNMDKIEFRMAIIGARMLESQKKAVEKVEAMKMRQNGESSVLANIANSVSEQITSALKIAAWWAGEASLTPAMIEDTTVSFTLNTDFESYRLTAQELVAMFSTMMQGGMSFDTYWANLVRGELADPKISADEERERIAKGTPLLMAPLTPPEPKEKTATDPANAGK